MAFQEYTLSGYDDSSRRGELCEIMVDVDVDTLNIIDLYTYRDSVPVLISELNYREYKVNVRDGGNPLFVHFVNKKHILKLLAGKGFVVCGEDDEKDLTLIQFKSKYNIQFD